MALKKYEHVWRQIKALVQESEGKRSESISNNTKDRRLTANSK